MTYCSYKWTKIGLIFTPDTSREWSLSHASAPVPLLLDDDGSCRVYYSARDENNASHVGYFDINLANNNPQLTNSSQKPVLRPGPIGYFDDHGVYASSVVRYKEYIYMYTIGWNPGPRRPLFYSSIGLAISEDGGLTFTKYGHSPIMSRSNYDPCLVTAPTVLYEEGTWRMWYVSGYRWEEDGNNLYSNYHIKYAESKDGVHWVREGHVAIDNALPDEKNISRMCVLPAQHGYSAWYGYSKNGNYRIGYAESEDGLIWHRSDDQVGIDLSSTGWDSEAMSYPSIVEYGEKKHMFYNGNSFGKDGIGIAIGYLQ